MIISLTIYSLLALATAIAGENTIPKYDVCVIGGGAGGASAAFYAKAAGQSVVLFEKEALLGGHCQTLNTSIPYVKQDVGAQLFFDTAAANTALACQTGSTTNDCWPVDIVALFGYLAGPSSILYVDHSVSPPVLSYDESTKTAGLVSFNYTAFGEALYNMYYVMGTLYPWSDARNDPVGALPAETLTSFKAFLDEHMPQWEALLSGYFYPQNYMSGLGKFDDSVAWKNIRQMGLTLIRQFTTPNATFAINGGCQRIYQGIANTLGYQNVVLNANITHVQRFDNGHNITVHLQGPANNQPVQYNCGKLVVGIPQTLENLAFMDLDAQEQSLFNGVSTDNFYTGRVNVQFGPFANNIVSQSQGFYLMYHTNSSNTQDYGISEQNSTWHGLIANLPTPYFPSVIFSSSDAKLSAADMRQTVDQQLTSMAVDSQNQAITGHEMLEFFYHEHYAHPSIDALSSSPNFFQRAWQMQGYRNTYYTGALFSMNGHHAIFNHACKVANLWNNSCTIALDRVYGNTVTAKAIQLHDTPSSVSMGVSGTSLIGIIMGSVILGAVLAAAATLLIKQNLDKAKANKAATRGDAPVDVLPVTTSKGRVDFNDVELTA